MSAEISEDEMRGLLARSYALRLVEDYVDTFDKPVMGKVPFQLLSDRQAAFDHIVDVLEQDLRLGEETPASEYCKSDVNLALKRFILNLLLSRHPGEDIVVSDNLCLKGMLVDGLKGF